MCASWKFWGLKLYPYSCLFWKNHIWGRIRVVSILKKLWYLKCQVMGSNTLLWGMSIPIFKLLPLKLRSRWNAQFYEAISLNFHLIKYSDAWKLTFFSLKWSWNDFKVKYAWIEVKKCLQKKFGVNGGIEWGFKGGLKNVKMLKNCSKLVFLDPHKIPLSNTIDPKFCL